jgi:hypothetical protein
MNTQLKNKIIKNLDVCLAADGFQFQKRFQEWRKVATEGCVFKIHLNFGKIVANPSVWYYSERLAALWRDSGLVSTDSSPELAQFGQMLTALSGNVYDGDTRDIADVIYSDINRLGFPYLARLGDFVEVARLLQSTNAKDWPVFGRDRRAYSLLILLAESGQIQQAFSLVPSLEAGLQGAVSVRPPFADFMRWFTHQYETNAV